MQFGALGLAAGGRGWSDPGHAREPTAFQGMSQARAIGCARLDNKQDAWNNTLETTRLNKALEIIRLK
jgi:hypothetical protein